MGYINRYYINGITLINRLLVGGDWNMADDFSIQLGMESSQLTNS